MDQKILIVSNSSWNIYNFRTGLIKAATQKGYIVFSTAPEDSYAGLLDSNYYLIKQRGILAFFFRDFYLLTQLYKIYKKLMPDIVLHFTIKMNIFGTIAAKLNRMPCINTVPGLGSVFTHKNLLTKVVLLLYKITQKYPEKICFLNNNDKELFFKQKIISETKAEMIPGSGVDTDKFKPYKNAATGKDEKNFTFLLFSRLIWDKGIKEFADAARILLKENKKIRFQLLGFLNCDNPYAIKKKFVNNWVKEEIIDYLGETDDVIPFINQSDCIVLPTYYGEGIPKSLLEAMSMEKPIITTDVPGCRDLVDDGINGFICKPKDADDLADKMLKMINLPENERRQMGKEGRKKVIKNYRKEIVASKYLKIITSVLDK